MSLAEYADGGVGMLSTCFLITDKLMLEAGAEPGINIEGAEV